MTEHQNSYAKASIERSMGLLEDPNAAELLSRKEIELATFVLENLIIPRYQKGEIRLRKEERDDNKFPVKTVPADEPFEMKSIVPAPIQYEVMKKFFRQRGVAEDSVDTTVGVAKFFLGNRALGMVTLPNNSAGAVLRPTVDLHRDQAGFAPVRLYERPVVIMKYEIGRPRLQSIGALVGASMLVAQAIGRSAEMPHVYPNRALVDQLEVYKASAAIVKVSLRQDKSQQLSVDDLQRLRVETLRQKHNDDSDPFRISPELVEDLRERRLISPAILSSVS